MFFTYSYLGLCFYSLAFVIFIFCVLLLSGAKLKVAELAAGSILLFVFLIFYYSIFYFRSFDVTDNEIYVGIYERIVNGGGVKESISLDFGFVLWNKLLAALGVKGEFFVELTAATIICVFLLTIALLSTSVSSLVVVVFLLLTSWSVLDLVFNTQRQGLAVAFVTLSLVLRERKSFKTAAVVLLVSASFHWSGYLLILIASCSWFFRRQGKSVNLLLIVAFLVFCISLLAPQVALRFLYYFLEIVSGYLPQEGVLSTKLYAYTVFVVEMSLFNRFRIALEFITVGIFICLYLIFFIQKKKLDARVQFEVAFVLLVSSLVTWSDYSFRCYALIVPYYLVVALALFGSRGKGVLLNFRVVALVMLYLSSHIAFWRSGVLFMFYRGLS